MLCSYLAKHLPMIPEDSFKCSFCKESYDLTLLAPKVLTCCRLCVEYLKNAMNQTQHCSACKRVSSSTANSEDLPTDQSHSGMRQTHENLRTIFVQKETEDYRAPNESVNYDIMKEELNREAQSRKRNRNQQVQKLSFDYAKKLKSLENKMTEKNLHIFKESNNFNNVPNTDFLIDLDDETFGEFLNSKEKYHDTKISAASIALFSDSENQHSEEESKSNKEYVAHQGGFNAENQVYCELKKELIAHYGHGQDPSKVSAHRTCRFIENLEPEEYDEILTRILKKILCISDVSETDLEEWKEAIQTRIMGHLKWGFRKTKKKPQKSNNNPVRQINRPYLKKTSRGAEVVFSSKWLKKYEREIDFREKVREILEGMGRRSFSVLQENLFELTQTLSQTYKSWRFENLSKRASWWYRYLKGNQDIADLWRNLPTSSDLEKQGYY